MFSPSPSAQRAAKVPGPTLLFVYKKMRNLSLTDTCSLSCSTIALISRQFREMTRARIEGLIASFPKLTSSGQQHTTIETDHVRYVYQPLEELFIVLITNKQSNILQGTSTGTLMLQTQTGHSSRRMPLYIWSSGRHGNNTFKRMVERTQLGECNEQNGEP